MLQDLGWLKRVKLLNSGGIVINPSTDEKLDELKTLLQEIEDNTDNLEITAENVNLNTDTLEAKLQSILDGASKVKLWDGLYNVKVSPESELQVKPPSQLLLEDHFNNTSLDINRWTENISNNGTVSVANSFCNLNVTTTNGDSAEIYSIQSFQHIFSQTYSFRIGIILDETSLNNNTRIWGMRNPITNDGWYFCLENGILKVCTEFNSAIISTNIDTYKPTDGHVHRYDAIYRNYRILFYIDGILVHTSHATITPLYEDEYLKPYFGNYNTGVTSIEVSLKIEGLALFDDTSSFIQISGIDENGLVRKVVTTHTGRLLVSQEPPSAPPETTSIKQTEYGLVSGSHDNVYVIPNGETFILQRFMAGSIEAAIGGSSVELWYDPDGDAGVNMEIIDVLFVNGTSDFHDLHEDYIGDGTKRIIMRRNKIGGGSTTIFGRWEGYY